MTEDTDVTVYSAIACPFSHRTRIALTVKGVPFKKVEVDLMNPPDWFTAGPARTQMPRLVTDDGTLHGACVVNEYIDERWKDPPLLPGTAAERATAREWINWLEAKLQPAYETPLLELDPKRFEELSQQLASVLLELEGRLQKRAQAGKWTPGDYWHGERLGMVDLTYGATVVRFVGLRRFHEWKMPTGLPAVTAWVATLRADPIVRETFGEEQVLEMIGTYRETLRAFAGN